MKRLIKKADAQNLQNMGINLNSELAISVIQERAPNFKKIGKQDTATGANSIYGIVSSNNNYIAEVYTYYDIDNKRWLVIVIAPIDKIKNNTIGANDLNISFTIFDNKKLNLSEIMLFINSINFISSEGEKIYFGQ